MRVKTTVRTTVYDQEKQSTNAALIRTILNKSAQLFLYQLSSSHPLPDSHPVSPAPQLILAKTIEKPVSV